MVNVKSQKDIVLFGAGQIAQDYMRKYGGLKKPTLCVDNDSKKWGEFMWDIPIESPDKIASFDKENTCILVCSKYVEQITKQLEQMGFEEYCVFDESRDYIQEIYDRGEGDVLPKYNIGYVPGVYDLYHVGHLNLIKKSKQRCNHLIVGVLTDELVYHFKKKYPYIPFEERMEIIKSIRYVDEVVKVDFSNTVKMDAWKQLKFDCHFSGDDHLRDWDVPIKALRKVGSNMEFFSYTKTTSSTQIKEKLGSRQ